MFGFVLFDVPRIIGNQFILQHAAALQTNTLLDSEDWGRKDAAVLSHVHSATTSMWLSDWLWVKLGNVSMKFFLKYLQVSVPYFSEISGSCTNFRLVLVVPDPQPIEMLSRTGSRWTLLAVRRNIFFWAAGGGAGFFWLDISNGVSSCSWIQIFGVWEIFWVFLNCQDFYISNRQEHIGFQKIPGEFLQIASSEPYDTICPGFGIWNRFSVFFWGGRSTWPKNSYGISASLPCCMELCIHIFLGKL